jgi:hypothetical protein
MAPVDEKGGKRHIKENGQLFQCEKCLMPEVVFA